MIKFLSRVRQYHWLKGSKKNKKKIKIPKFFKKKDKKEKKTKQSTEWDPELSSSSSEISEKSVLNLSEALFASTQKKILPGQLTVIPHLENYLLQLLADERPDIDVSKLSEIEASLLDNSLRLASEFAPGDQFFTDDNFHEDERTFTRYTIQLTKVQKYNEGRYSAIYLAMRAHSLKGELTQDPLPYLVKVTLRRNSARSTRMLRKESRVLLDVGNKRFEQKKIPFTPIQIDQGRIGDLSYLVMNYLDRNLAKIREECRGEFSQTTAIHVAVECFNALADFHGRNYVHRDIKPTNYCAGVEDMAHKLFLIDFGDSVKKTNNRQTRLGVPDGLTLPYWSLEAHLTGFGSQRGDIESWFYMVIELVEPKSFFWSKECRVSDTEEKKKKFWSDYRDILSSKLLISLADFLNEKKEINFPKDHLTVKQKLMEALEEVTKGNRRWTVDWLKKAPQQRPAMAKKKPPSSRIKGKK